MGHVDFPEVALNTASTILLPQRKFFFMDNSAEPPAPSHVWPLVAKGKVALLVMASKASAASASGRGATTAPQVYGDWSSKGTSFTQARDLWNYQLG